MLLAAYRVLLNFAFFLNKNGAMSLCAKYFKVIKILYLLYFNKQ